MSNRSLSTLLCSAACLLMLAACDSGGSMPLDSQKWLDSMAGPKFEGVDETQLKAAQAHEKEGDYRAAGQIYQQLLDKKRGDPEIMFLLAETLRRGGETDKALASYDIIIEQGGGNDVLLRAKEAKALTLIAKGDYEGPSALLQEVMKQDKRRWKTLNGMGILFVTRNMPAEAEQYFNAAQRENPSSVSVMNNLGLAQALMKNYPASIDTLSRASSQTVSGSNDRKRIDLNLSMVYATAGKLDDAKRIAEIYFTGPQLKNNLGLYAHLAKDDALAESYLNMALTESKTYYARAWENLETISKKKQGNASSPSESNSNRAKSGGTLSVPAPESRKSPTQNPKSGVTSEKSRGTAAPVGGVSIMNLE
jgi:Flp pilus assembly protein TadD